MVIPKLYHGKDKTFFFVDYEGFRNSVQIFERGNIPTLRMRTGDFGELLPNTLIYDPLTTVPNPAKPGRFSAHSVSQQHYSSGPLGPHLS